jgi:hypothetical protein
MKYFLDTSFVIALFNKNDNFVIYPINPEIIDKGLKIYSTYKDKYWGLVDCISFSLMKNENISLALTTDNHFKQAGFKALLL